MSKTIFYLRGVLTIVLVSLLLWLAEQSVPMGSLIVFMLAFSIGITWIVINLLKDDSILSDLFGD